AEAEGAGVAAFGAAAAGAAVAAGAVAGAVAPVDASPAPGIATVAQAVTEPVGSTGVDRGADAG
ncbi:hypothetical protein QN416_26625, partial [Glaciimonas sp. Cout2]|uniref:hypothetical protein n=1 Tax=Glaciimonas sp. Cout2 TaxID=3048621 RepID=UPI002B2285A4